MKVFTITLLLVGFLTVISIIVAAMYEILKQERSQAESKASSRK